MFSNSFSHNYVNDHFQTPYSRSDRSRDPRSPSLLLCTGSHARVFSFLGRGLPIGIRWAREPGYFNFKASDPYRRENAQ